MRILIALTITCLCSINSLGQHNSVDTVHNSLARVNTPEIVIQYPGTLEIKDVSEKKETLPSNMPWIAALIIGGLSALINLWVADRLKKSNEKNIDRQLNNAKDIALAEFGATLGTKNRQDWIDDLRHNLSEFISHSAMINVELSSDVPNNETVKGHFQKMNYNKAKIAMMINPEKEEQKDVLDQVYEMISICFKPKDDYDAKQFKDIEDNLLTASRKLFGIHWKKIKDSFKTKE